MGDLLPDEFPFGRRRDGGAPLESVAPVGAVEEGVLKHTLREGAPVARVEEEALIEVVSGGQVMYRGKERRRSPRQALRAKAVFRAENANGPSGPVQVMNLSMFGVRFWSPRGLSEGDRGSVKMEVGPVKWSSKVRVVNCQSLGDEGFVVGGEFVVNEISRRRVEAA